MEKVIIVAGGPPEYWPDIQEEQFADSIWIGVDRGAWQLLKQGIVPTMAIGDFDSLSISELKLVENSVQEIFRAPAEKDDTDTALALKKVIERYPNHQMILIGATGGRLDHFLASLWLPMKKEIRAYAEQLTIIDQQNVIQYFLPGNHEIKKRAGKAYLSFVCLTPIEKLSLYQTKYPLTNYDVSEPISYVSNEFINDTAQFTFEKGLLAVIQSND